MLLTMLWLQGGVGEATPADGRWQDCAVLAHELLAGRKPAALPAMVVIAERSIAAARARSW